MPRGSCGHKAPAAEPECVSTTFCGVLTWIITLHSKLKKIITLKISKNLEHSPSSWNKYGSYSSTTARSFCSSTSPLFVLELINDISLGSWVFVFFFKSIFNAIPSFTVNPWSCLLVLWMLGTQVVQTLCVSVPSMTSLRKLPVQRSDSYMETAPRSLSSSSLSWLVGALL